MRNMGGDPGLERELTLFERYLSGECSPDETQQVEHLIRADVRRSNLLRDLAALKQAARALDEGWNIEQMWRQLHAQLELPASVAAANAPAAAVAVVSSPTPVRSFVGRWAWPLGRAAALVVLAIGGTLLWDAISVRPGVATAPTALRVYSTQPGQQAVVHLLDGTKVTLSASGTLVVPKDFSRGARDVQLDGEAYFEVAENAAAPFRVRTGNVVTRVLGTQFGVRSYANEQRVQVVVASGRVSVWPEALVNGNARSETELGPGDLARVSPDGTIYVEHHVDVGRYLSWREGWLTFIDAPVSEILAELERWTGIEFTLGDPTIASRVLTTRIRPGAVQATLAVLEAGLNVRAVQSASGIRLEGVAANSSGGPLRNP